MVPAVGRARRGRGRGRRRADPRRAADPFAVVDVRRRRRELHGLGPQPRARRGRDVRRPPGTPAHRGARDHVRRRDAARGGLAVEVGAARVRRPLAARPRRNPLGVPRLLRARVPARGAPVVSLRGAALRSLDVGARGRAALGGGARFDRDVDPAAPRRPARRPDARVRVHGRSRRRATLAGVVRRGSGDRRVRDDGQAARAGTAACARRGRALEAGGRAETRRPASAGGCGADGCSSARSRACGCSSRCC